MSAKARVACYETRILNDIVYYVRRAINIKVHKYSI